MSTELLIRHLREAKEYAKSCQINHRRRMYRKNDHCLQLESFNLGGQSRVDIPAGTDQLYPQGPDPKNWSEPWTTVTNPEEIARHVCTANTRQYHQATNTPFATEPLVSYIGPEANTLGTDNLLRRNMPPDETTLLLQPETIQLLRMVATNNTQHAHPGLDINISVEAFQSCYKAVKENTSSSPSGRHVGHYKAAAMNDHLSAIHAMMMTIPFRAGFSPQRWHRVVDIMLEKQPGNSQIHRLRILPLLERDFNQAVHIIIARQLSFHLEDNNMVPAMQYGSQEGHQYVSAVLNKQLTHDIICHKKSTAAFIENDATGCYDRMVNNLMLLELCRLGLPMAAVHALWLTWANTIHHVKTVYGTSTTTYQNSKEVPLFGPGQGSTFHFCDIIHP
jgi:hypothetical protein